jgi:cellulose synthase/poly-beta-1,6-N-acetylglucosamine synthase-like glycosyltransferase
MADTLIYYTLWVLSFIGLFLVLFWINILLFKQDKKIVLKEFPFVTIIIPAHNEEGTIEKTIRSVLNLDYPNDKLEIIVVDDESNDNTYSIASKFTEIKIIRNKHEGIGKASAVNSALRIARGEFFGVVDADSEVSKDSLKIVLGYFTEDKVGGVISAIKVSNSGKMFTGLQKYEYIFTALARELMSRIKTLHLSHGVLSVFRTNLIKRLGYFDESSLTEDLEIAMRVRANFYEIRMAADSITYTNVPMSFSALWRQRVRWYRGMLQSVKKYGYVLFNPKYNFYGMFQVPLIFLTLFSLFLVSVLFFYKIIDFIINYGIKIFLLKSEIVYTWQPLSPKVLLLSFDVKFLFPVIIVLILNIYLLYRAHKLVNEKAKIFNVLLIVYFIIYPILTMFHWVTALVQEVFKINKKW